MSNKTDTKIDLNKRDFCEILTPEFIGKLLNGMSCSYSEGYIEEDEFIEYKTKIEKLRNFCK